LARDAELADEQAQNLRAKTAGNLAAMQSAMDHAQRVVLDKNNPQVSSTIADLNNAHQKIASLLGDPTKVADATNGLTQALSDLNALLTTMGTPVPGASTTPPASKTPTK
jgi:hypothetical protein